MLESKIALASGGDREQAEQVIQQHCEGGTGCSPPLDCAKIASSVVLPAGFWNTSLPHLRLSLAWLHGVDWPSIDQRLVLETVLTI